MGASGRHNIATIVANNIAIILEATIETKSKKKCLGIRGSKNSNEAKRIAKKLFFVIWKSRKESANSLS